MPNPALTPGAIQSSDSAAICTPGWAEAHRDVSYTTEDYVAREYGLSSHYGYEIDHLIPLELGGSNSVRNLWPEPYNSPYGANQKDGGGYSHSYYTDSSGYADVYLRGPQPGQQITVTVSGATCSTTAG